MSKKSSIKMTLLFVLSVSLIAAAAAAVFLTSYYSRLWFHMLGSFCGEIIQRYPDSRQAVLEFLKTQKSGTAVLDADIPENILTSFGYQPSDFWGISLIVIRIAVLGFLMGSIVFLFAFWYWHRRSSARIKALTGYLEKINTGGQGLLLDASEDEFSKLQDELYKTVTTLYQTRDAALTAQRNYAENLSNIAHQLKTPITSISLSVQMMKEHSGDIYLTQIERQITRLTHLENALLLLSRIDAGTLVLERKPTDVFTLLMLAFDNLQELFAQTGVLIDIPEMGEMDIDVDLDWTMEAVMNLMKNCMESAESGATVHCSYEKNPLYVQIRIWDEGQGFAKEDFPHLFERFYRGKGAKDTGIGIGLSISKAIIEMQNGIISAYNLPVGGACFEIRFYSH